MCHMKHCPMDSSVVALNVLPISTKAPAWGICNTETGSYLSVFMIMMLCTPYGPAPCEAKTLTQHRKRRNEVIAMRVGRANLPVFEAQGNSLHANEVEEVMSSAMHVCFPPVRPPCLYGLCLVAHACLMH